MRDASSPETERLSPLLSDRRYEEIRKQIVFNAEANPDTNKLDELRKRSKRFRNTWEGKRTDLAGCFPSGYGFSLSSQALNHGWSIQEIVNLLICWRRKHGIDLGLDRPDWYLKHTILRAEADLEGEKAATRLEEENGANREQVLKNLTMATRLHQKGYHFLGFYQHGTDNAQYSLEVATGRGVKSVRIGPTKELRSVDRLRDLLLSHFGLLLPVSITRERWMNMLANILPIRELRNPESDSDSEQVYDWVERHCTVWAPPHDEDREDGWQGAVPLRDPFKKDGCLYVSAVRLRAMLTRDGQRVSQADLTQMLSLAGFVRKSVSTRIKGKVVTASYWWIGLDKFPQV